MALQLTPPAAPRPGSRRAATRLPVAPAAPRLMLAVVLAAAVALAAGCGPRAAAGVGSPPAAGAAEAGTTEILWDVWGVPHIHAADAEGLAYGYGWAQMHSHGDALLRLYGLARGRGAEYWGERYLESDRLLRTLAIPERSVAAYRSQSPAFRRYLDAFAEGVNAYAAAHPETLAPELRPVLPVAAVDLVRHAQRLVFTFAAATGSRPPIVGLDGLPTGAVPGPPAGAAPPGAGSNTWAIGAARSATGNGLLLQNPHLPWHEPFMRFYEARLVAPQTNIHGATLLGLPVPLVAFNDRLGWSHTVNTIDVLDTYRLVLAEGGYRFDGAVRAFETERQLLRVRQPDGTLREDTLRIRRSVHGPVLMGAGDTAAVAVRTPVLERYGMLEQWWAMAHARDLAEFEAALRRMELPMFTVTYADRDGRVLYLFAGQVPRRPHGDFGAWQVAVRGDTSATLWHDVLDYDELPRVVDPPSGYVQNSNSPPWFATLPAPLDPSAFPAYLAPDYLLPREQQALALLEAEQRFTLERLVELRHASGVRLAHQLLDDLVAAARGTDGTLPATDAATAADAADVLAAWDRTTEPGSRGAVLFALWAQEQCRGPLGNLCGFARPWDRTAPLATPAGLADPALAVARLAAVAARVRERFGALDVAWGDVMRIREDLPGRGGPGDPLGIFHVVSYASGPRGFRPVHGDSWVAAVEFTPHGPRGQVLMAYGNASQPGSPHDGDQLVLLSQGRMRPLWFTRAEVEANLRERVVLRR
jgi:acyl-homoserine-lactone acylase